MAGLSGKMLRSDLKALMIHPNLLGTQQAGGAWAGKPLGTTDMKLKGPHCREDAPAMGAARTDMASCGSRGPWRSRCLGIRCEAGVSEAKPGRPRRKGDSAGRPLQQEQGKEGGGAHAYCSAVLESSAGRQGS